MKRVFALLFALMMTLSLAACGGTDTSDPNAGLYVCTAVSMAGMDMAADSLFDDEVTMELKGNGKGTMNLEGEAGNFTYVIDGTTFSFDITSEGETITSTGTLENGVITVDLLGSG
ncbi:MAG: hypothetical protein HUJ67_04245, partial [Ruminiclostridium sp.]|nr:hypothetical protein [Ruminiclostridium sp.]